MFRSSLSVLLALIVISTSSAQSQKQILSAFITDQQTIEVRFSEPVEATAVSISSDDGAIRIATIDRIGYDNDYKISVTDKFDFSERYTVKAEGAEKVLKPHWKAIDRLYTYEGELGALYNWNKTDFKLWAPLASKVVLNLYNSGFDEDPYQTFELLEGEKGVWNISVPGNLKGKFYTYSVTNYGETKEALDPYAKSLAATKRSTFFKPRGAIVDPASLGTELDFAEIEGFEKREDGIIWEIHVWDFTVDPYLNTEATFGTYDAFTEKIDYITNLGVTHVQLLPVLSYTYSDEVIPKERVMEYKLGTNYNWGYGPDSYFSVEGLYSENPQDPELRIKELKNLIDAIHNNGMGVILDVVYNHNASMSFFNDIVPDYYHFVDETGVSKGSYGGGRLGSTHAMVRKLIVDSIIFWTKEYKVDGFRYDLMGDLDAKTIQIAFDEAQKINPDILMVGECWRTFVGDDNEKVTPADQDWMGDTNSVACFSDEMRNELKSGYGSEGQPRFVTNGPRPIELIFNNVIGKPSNMTEDDPGDVLQYVAAHDNLTLHDAIAHSILKDPLHHQEEIHKRIRLANTIILTSQGTTFIHAGQEFGRTKQWKSETAPEREFLKIDEFEHPYFIENSYDASEAINLFDWKKVTEEGIHKRTMEYTKGLIELRKSSNAFRLGDEEKISENVSLIRSKDIEEEDLVLFFKTVSTAGEEFYILINADSKERKISVDTDLRSADVLVDSDEAGSQPVKQVSGVQVSENEIKVEPLTAIVLKRNN